MSGDMTARLLSALTPGNSVIVCGFLSLAGCGKTPPPIPLTPFLARKGVKVISGGYPQTPTKGASPLWTPFFQQPAR